MIDVRFSPKGGCEAMMLKAISGAKSSLYGSIFSFTSLYIANALVSAVHANVKVSLICDPRVQTEPGNKWDILKAWVTVNFDSKHAEYHDKYLIVDERVLYTGSYNWTEAAEHSNAENLLKIPNKALCAKYLSNWNLHLAHSTPAGA